MYLIREVLYCEPGQVRPMVKKFQALSDVSESMGYPRFRLLTDVSGERFWTLIAEMETESVDAFREMEEALMANPDAQQAMAGYHDLILEGRREIYTIED